MTPVGPRGRRSLQPGGNLRRLFICRAKLPTSTPRPRDTSGSEIHGCLRWDLQEADIRFPPQACITITGRSQQRRQNTKNRVLILEKDLVLFLTSSSRRSTLITADVLQIGKKNNQIPIHQRDRDNISVTQLVGCRPNTTPLTPSRENGQLASLHFHRDEAYGTG